MNRVNLISPKAEPFEQEDQNFMKETITYNERNSITLSVEGMNLKIDDKE